VRDLGALADVGQPPAEDLVTSGPHQRPRVGGHQGVQRGERAQDRGDGHHHTDRRRDVLRRRTRDPSRLVARQDVVAVEAGEHRDQQQRQQERDAHAEHQHPGDVSDRVLELLTELDDHGVALERDEHRDHGRDERLGSLGEQRLVVRQVHLEQARDHEDGATEQDRRHHGELHRRDQGDPAEIQQHEGHQHQDHQHGLRHVDG
jgi:hypothetical protein